MRKPGVLLFVVLLACTKTKSEAKPDDAAPPPATPIASTRPVDARDQARSTVLKWSDALDRHDLAALESVYAPTVDHDGNTVTRAAEMDAKKRAFAAAPTFRQSIVGSIALTPDGEAWVHEALRSDPEPGGGFSASIGVHHPDRFESHARGMALGVRAFTRA